MFNYLGQTAHSVSVEYSDMPTGVEIMFVNKTSGEKTPVQGNPLSTGNGVTAIAFPALSAGDYYLLAQTGGGQYIAQTVVFHIN